MQHSIDTLPEYLKVYCVKQEADNYTPEDHAAWRFIMRQSRKFFSKHGVSGYVEGLSKSGIFTDRIPLISEIDEAMRKFGWGAVPVRGFIPPFAFLELQSRKILPIASDMRQADHILYTPAPDIVHEAAGHAPILTDPTFSKYITKYANLAKKAIFCEEDLEQYEAIRILSDVKENPDSTSEDIEDAEKALIKANENVPFISEAAKVARMYWWTAEYGLVGDLQDPKIYGAGLLSSVKEARECLSNHVKKIPLTVDCVDQGYDITKLQPQLFVAKDLDHLCEVLADLEAMMSFKIGGAHGLETAKSGRTVVSVELNSFVSVSGKVTEYLKSGDQITFVKLSGPVQIACDEQELEGQGTSQHPEGFSSPIGFWKKAPDRQPHTLSEDELKDLGVAIGQNKSIEFVSGFKVSGDIAYLEFKNSNLVLIKWKNCSVTGSNKVYFDPSWGDFDMIVGSTVTSVYGGAADREKFGRYKLGETKTSPKRTSLPTATEQKIYQTFKKSRELRETLKKGVNIDTAQIATLFADECTNNFPSNWLLRLESLELLALTAATYAPAKADFDRSLKDYLGDYKKFDQAMLPYIEHALRYVDEH